MVHAGEGTAHCVETGCQYDDVKLELIARGRDSGGRVALDRRLSDIDEPDIVPVEHLEIAI